ncbi:hypothetical protein [Aquihabitans sp. McL0605]|uniref:hypothetical protein n=1 Tax=Aquihabitans sp. McL0605 TaxID=3415671 RepID=UPI003CE8CDFE
MSWFKRHEHEGPDGGTATDEHVRPVEIDLGLQKEFEIEMEVERLKSAGLSVYLVAQSENPRLGSLFPKHCHLYVRPDEEPRVRAELASTGYL